MAGVHPAGAVVGDDAVAAGMLGMSPKNTYTPSAVKGYLLWYSTGTSSKRNRTRLYCLGVAGVAGVAGDWGRFRGGMTDVNPFGGQLFGGRAHR